MRFDGLMGAKEILSKARDRVKDYRSSSSVTSPQQRNTDPPPPYSPSPYFPTSPYQFYTPPGSQGAASTREQPDQDYQPSHTPNAPIAPNTSTSPSALYPPLQNEEELAKAMNSTAIGRES